MDSPSGIGANEAFDKSLDDDQPSTKPQGWLKWLSRGMLGAGGTDDSSQFSGVVSDEVIKVGSFTLRRKKSVFWINNSTGYLFLEIQLSTTTSGNLIMLK